ncbi:hypothetical protein [Nocardia rhizosphaerae]|uniref:Uncharacterized protein n=1 Tax=Nocardia rhizosphaerae TaxID=1691571 RepID=A0ABV8KXS3_9NOCA
MTPEIRDRIVTGVRTVLDDHLQDLDIFAWRFTLPTDSGDPVHRELETQWRSAHPGAEPDAEATYEIALSLVGDPADLTDTEIAGLEHGLVLAVYGAAEHAVPFTLCAHQRTGVERESDPEYR